MTDSEALMADMNHHLNRIAGALEKSALVQKEISMKLSHLAMALTPRPPPPLRNDAESYVVPDIDRPKKPRRKAKP